jgi:6-phosphofructokinase
MFKALNCNPKMYEFIENQTISKEELLSKANILNKEIIEKAIEDVKNYNIYQDLAKNKYTILGYIEKGGKKEPIDRPLVLKGDIPQYLVDYSNMDNSSKGYIKLKLSKKQFSERLRDGILKSDDAKTIESKVLENYYNMKEIATEKE